MSIVGFDPGSFTLQSGMLQLDHRDLHYIYDVLINLVQTSFSVCYLVDCDIAGCLCQVKVDKFLTPEQWKKLEENRRIEEEKRLREKGDNWRERGLDQMMGGVLEVKKEDELKKVYFLDIFARCL